MTNNEPAPAAPDAPPVQADPMAPDQNAPYGYMVDPVTGEKRAKLRPGRQKVTAPAPAVPFSGTGGPPPPVDELKTRPPIEHQEDRPPDDGKRHPRGKRSKTRDPKSTTSERTPAPPFRAGPIAAGVNKLYARAGKIVRAWDHSIGSAIVGVTRKESEDDVTIGEAWEEVARVNPRIRAFLLRMIEGSAWSQLIMAHAPILLAVLMKDGIRKRLPLGGLLSSLLDDDEDGTPSDISDAMGGMQADDVQQMVSAGLAMMDQLGVQLGAMGRRSGMPRDPGVVIEPPDQP